VLKHGGKTRIMHFLHCWRCSSYVTRNHYQLKDGGALCSFCSDKNPLGKLIRLPLILLTHPLTIYVAFTRSGKHAQASAPISRPRWALGWYSRQGTVLERALVYQG
jgi:hypothetical protein